ncbi:MAG: L-dehydroascorbate transporter large permease subunit [Paenibacillaceae bacterium ZCTH02-B3]|nr:MAG: L-dehydroascorbate transporter large permease subunit [Paenibacillaceae bacterium ZCTH02-B3]
MTILLFVVVLLGAMVLGMPIAFALLVTSVFLMFYMDTFSAQIVAQNLINGADNFPLMAIPFFMLAGELMNAGGLSRRIVNFALALVGHIRGGLGYVAIMAGVLFASMSGSALADTAAIGAILIPMMVKSGYNINRASGLIASSGIIAPVIPPSIGFILYGIIGSVSITKLFMAGIVPGLLMGLALTVTWTLLARKENVERQRRHTLKEIWQKFREAFWALLMPVIIIGGLRGGIFTPTEVAVVVAVYALLVGAFVYRELNLKSIYQALVRAARTSSVVMFLICAALVTSWLMAIANLPAQVVEALQPFLDNKILLLLMINLLVVIIGTAMDMTPTILILTPVLLPIIKAAGIDPVYFGVLFMINCSIGLLTPPVGTVLNVMAGVSKISLESMIRGVLPFLLAQLLVLLMLILFPELVLVPLDWLT